MKTLKNERMNDYVLILEGFYVMWCGIDCVSFVSCFGQTAE